VLRPLLLALLAAASASAQPAGAVLDGPRAEAVADSLFRDLLAAERAHFGDARTVALHGDAGSLYYRIGGDGVECRADVGLGLLRDLGELFCLSPTALGLEDDADDSGGDDSSPMYITVEERSWDQGIAHVVHFDEPGGADSGDLWIAPDPLRLVRIDMWTRLPSGAPMDLRLERTDFRTVGGVLVPHTFRFAFLNPAAMMADEGVAPSVLLEAAQQQAEAKPTAEAAALLAFAKSVAAGVPYEVALTIVRVEVDGPLPAGLFDGESGPVTQPAAGGGRP
jgi:hypothetical protein